MFESIAAWMVVALFALGVWLMASAVWGSPARAKPAVTKTTPAKTARSSTKYAAFPAII